VGAKRPRRFRARWILRPAEAPPLIESRKPRGPATGRPSGSSMASKGSRRPNRYDSPREGWSIPPVGSWERRRHIHSYEFLDLFGKALRTSDFWLKPRRGRAMPDWDSSRRALRRRLPSCVWLAPRGDRIDTRLLPFAVMLEPYGPCQRSWSCFPTKAAVRALECQVGTARSRAQIDERNAERSVQHR
jgi:hypothetical protein